MNLGALKAANLKRWHDCSVSQSLMGTFDVVARRLVDAKGRYVTVELQTNVPWPVIAVIHERESSQSWAASLAQGDPWSHVSIHVPAGRGPFKSWEDAAIDALCNCSPHAADWDDWSIEGTLTLLESYNGLGYFRMGAPSPYVWAGTNQYIRGKYIADGHFDPNAIDHQLGCAGLIQRMAKLDSTISEVWHP